MSKQVPANDAALALANEQALARIAELEAQLSSAKKIQAVKPDFSEQVASAAKAGFKAFEVVTGPSTVPALRVDY